MNVGVVIPCYEHGATVGAVVEGLARFGLPCLLLDDGSGPATREALEGLAKRHAFVEVLRSPENLGKGATLKLGYRAAAARGWDGAIQLDADGQHDPADVPRFARAMQSQPGALVLGVPVFDASVPRTRLYARQLSRGLVWAACTDSGAPPQVLTFSLSGAVPARASITAAGVFTWTPSEAQGPGDYTFSVVVSDGLLTDSETITVHVNEINLAPVLDQIGNKAVEEGIALMFTATASDVDIPAQTLTFSLAGHRTERALIQQPEHSAGHQLKLRDRVIIPLLSG